MSCDKYARIITKTGQGQATIPVSPDHRNGDWLATDIYIGEFYQDLSTGTIYTRNNSGIVVITNPTSLFGENYNFTKDTTGGSTNSTSGYGGSAPTTVLSSLNLGVLPAGTYRVFHQWNWNSDTLNQRSMFRSYARISGGADIFSAEVIIKERKDSEDRETESNLFEFTIGAPTNVDIELRVASSSVSNTVTVFTSTYETFETS